MKLGGVFLVAVLVLGACGDDGGDGDDDQSPPTTGDPPAGQVGALTGDLEQGIVEVTAAPDPPVAGESVVWSFGVTNTSEEPMTLTFSSGQRADVVLADGGEEVYRWSEGQVFTQAIEDVTIEAGETVTFDLESTLEIGPGTYELIATLTSDPAPSAMQRTIQVEAGD